MRRVVQGKREGDERPVGVREKFPETREGSNGGIKENLLGVVEYKITRKAVPVGQDPCGYDQAGGVPIQAMIHNLRLTQLSELQNRE